MRKFVGLSGSEICIPVRFVLRCGLEMEKGILQPGNRERSGLTSAWLLGGGMSLLSFKEIDQV